jgi:arylsulfatase A-like enzyme
VPNPGQYGQGVATVKLDFANDLFNDEILKFMDSHTSKNRDKPFFIYAAFTAPHANNESKLSEVPDLGIYKDKDWPEPEKLKAALITRLDRYVGDLVAKIHDKGLDSNTLIIFTSDNGPHEEGGNSAAFDKASGPLRGIKRSMYEGGTRVPFIARWTGTIKPDSATSQPIAFYDFLPTAADLARGIGVPPMSSSGSIDAPPTNPAPSADGISFLPTLLGKPDQQKQHDYFYWEFHENGFHQSLLLPKENWKAVRHGLTAPIELYDLNKDLGEKTNVAAEHPDVVQKITQIFAAARVTSPEFKVAGE